MAKKTNSKRTIETLTHEEATRKNIPTAEYQSVMQKDDQAPVKVSYPRGSAELADEKHARNRDPGSGGRSLNFRFPGSAGISGNSGCGESLNTTLLRTH